MRRMATWAGVIRVSDMNGRDEESDRFRSARDQEEAMRGALPPKDRLDVLPAELDVSGGLPVERRPSLRAAVEGVETGKYVGIIVAYQSRLGRDTEVEESVWRRVEAGGGRIILALDGIDTTTVDGRMVRRIRSAINHAERERHIDQFDRLRRALTIEGVWQTRMIPFGYKKDARTRKLVPADTTRLRWAFEQRAAGVSYARIGEALGMSYSGVAHMLANRVYLGELRVGEHFNPRAHPALLTEDEWLRAQHARTTRAPRVRSGPPLLGGLVICAGCGHVMTPAGKPRSYACRRLHSGGKCPAPAAMSERKLDALVEEVARAEVADLRARANAATTDLADLRHAVQGAEVERDAFLVGVRAADLPPGVYAQGLRTRQETVESTQQALAEALSAHHGAAWDGDPFDLWEEMNGEQRNHALRGLLDGVVVRRAGGPGGGRGPAASTTDRVRILARGSALRRDGVALFPDSDSPHVLGM